MHKQIHLTPTQEEKLRELGAYLREIRLRNSLSLYEVEEKTRIKACVLEAIEEAKAEELPEPVYVRALIKQFADALGLEGKELATAFPIDPNIRGIQPSWQPVRRYNVRLFPWYLAYTLILVCAMSGFSLLFSRSGENLTTTSPLEEENSNTKTTEVSVDPDNKPTPTPKPEIAPQTPTQAVAESPQETKKTPTTPEVASQAPPTPPASSPVTTAAQPVSDRPGETPPAPNPNSPVVISMTLQDDCWLKVVADGKIVYQGTLSKGEQKTWQASEQITVVAGNAGGVVVAINNQEAKPLGTPGSVETATFRPSEPRS
ncbi:helix-turn-helix domain-containing protein [Spirulina sp. 06S082]|uniref:helix-turn-helix domain-containing protein n=1 Tax=Spirulina sp. 06S082 TaxID=3110248 RepID=UPI002B1EA0D5|nr:RodZ domain-containing protein [Spirulina sp. 06S082]MEA5472191.1 RodZ domain-containing protein [Spirulina sp. 06S082]